MQNTDIILMDNNSLGMMLNPGETRIHPSADFEGRVGCGLIPIGIEKCLVATQGYKWNVGDYASNPRSFGELSFNKFISTSNEIIQEVVEVHSSGPLFYCTSILAPKL